MNSIFSFSCNDHVCFEKCVFKCLTEKHIFNIKDMFSVLFRGSSKIAWCVKDVLAAFNGWFTIARWQCAAVLPNDTWGICTRRAGKLYKTRSLLYRSQILQQNMRWKALAEIYIMNSFAQLCNLKFLSQVCQKCETF